MMESDHPPLSRLSGGSPPVSRRGRMRRLTAPFRSSALPNEGGSGNFVGALGVAPSTSFLSGKRSAAELCTHYFQRMC